MRPRWRDLIERAVEEGALGGVSKAFKYTDTPDHDLIAERVTEYIMLELDELID